MKFIFFCVTVSTIVLNLSMDFVNPHKPPPFIGVWSNPNVARTPFKGVAHFQRMASRNDGDRSDEIMQNDEGYRSDQHDYAGRSEKFEEITCKPTTGKTTTEQITTEQITTEQITTEQITTPAPKVYSGTGLHHPKVRVKVPVGNTDFTPITASSIRPPRISDGTLKEPLSVDYLKDMLKQQFDKMATRIAKDVWVKCTEEYPLPGFDRFDLFTNFRPTETNVSLERKCLIDCALREMGVLNSDGFNVAEYMKQIKQLRFNYTSVDMRREYRESNQTRINLLTAIEEETMQLGSVDKCHAVLPTEDEKRGKCNRLEESYLLAAEKCKYYRDPGRDVCETSWKVFRCMNDDHHERHLRSPFYPIPYFESEWISVMRNVLDCDQSD